MLSPTTVGIAGAVDAPARELTTKTRMSAFDVGAIEVVWNVLALATELALVSFVRVIDALFGG
jgi:hypothetical protein